MTGDRIVSLVVLLGLLVLVGSGLWRRRLPAGRMVRLGLWWLAIFASVWAVVELVQHRS